MPRGHDTHDVEPCTALEYVPVAQCVHASLSETALSALLLYFPATHAVHTLSHSPSLSSHNAWLYPALHRHSLSLRQLTQLAPEFTGHPTQLALPSASRYVPTKQFTHGPPHGPLVPAGHARHAATASTDAFENACPASQVQAPSSPQPTHDAPEFAGHGTHADASFAPTVVEYVLDGQLEHAPEPLVFFHVPAAQAVHTPPSGPVYPASQGKAGNGGEPGTQ